MPLSTEELRGKIRSQQWTAHNIRLNAECTTIPGEPDFLATDLRLKAIFRVLETLFSDDFHGLRVADLGCLEGGFSLALAQRGAEVLGVEARRRNIEKSWLLQEHFALPNLRFQQSDVKDFGSANEEFDVVLALGILYHLDRPVEWLQQIARATKRVLILDTHFAPADEAAMARLDSRLHSLGPVTMQAGERGAVEGRWFQEFAEGVDPEGQLWASYSNNKSFWLTKKSLLQTLVRAGFRLVLEQHDYSAEEYDLFNATYPRCMLLGVRS